MVPSRILTLTSSSNVKRVLTLSAIKRVKWGIKHSILKERSGEINLRDVAILKNQVAIGKEQDCLCEVTSSRCINSLADSKMERGMISPYDGHIRN